MNALSPMAKAFLQENKGKHIVFTNGCFDILHVGHVKYLCEAKNCGDLLFVGLNSDDSVRTLKGQGRPINGEHNRKYMLEQLRPVDFVEIFPEETPYRLIAEVRPRILVKGGDWKEEQVVGLDLVRKDGGIVKCLDFQDGHSTSKLIEKIQNYHNPNKIKKR